MAYALMGTTLPTVIGMGVTSQAIQTMFGKGTKATRTFAGKKYKLANWHATKKLADRDAAQVRKLGHSARVVKAYNRRMKRWGYMVYVR